jgi:hypothetical protein
MFNLESSITRWREQMHAAGIQTPVPLEELEAHLREDIAGRVSTGLREADAFAAAVRELGQADALQTEFTKSSPEPHARRVNEWIYFSTMAVVAGFVVTCLVFKVGGFGALSVAQRWSCLAAVATMLLLAFGGRLAHGFFPVIPSKRIRDVIGVTAGGLLVLGYILSFRIVLPHVDFTVSQLVVFVLWVMAPMSGLFGGLITGLDVAARKRAR